MEYTEVKIRVEQDSEHREIITALLADIGFESFSEDSDFLIGYIPSKLFDYEEIENIFSSFFYDSQYEFSYKAIAEENWNAVWESNYPPVIIDNIVSIRAPFHSAPDGVQYHIIIEPKMSFGTAHHSTTAQIISLMLNIDFTDKIIMDMGCGTSVLAILASMKGAKWVDAVDNDEWAYNNSVENVKRNHIENINVSLSDANFLDNSKLEKYDIFIANINRNILLNDMDRYVKTIKPKGLLLMSGFYDVDLEIISKKAAELGMKFVDKQVSNDWCAGIWMLN